MNVVIIEDEYAAANNLKAILNEIDPEIEITGVFESVTETINWFTNNPEPDLAFFDIKLTDGTAFEIFEKISINCAVIFITAYNQYAVKAFKLNSIDYILKPVSKKAVYFAINKYLKIKNYLTSNNEDKILSILKQIKEKEEKIYRKSFLVNYKDRLIPVEVSEFCYFYIDHGNVYGVTKMKKRYMLNHKLEQIGNQLDPDMFIRANRQFIISRGAIREVHLSFNGKLSLTVRPPFPDKIIISKAKASEFRNWLDH